MSLTAQFTTKGYLCDIWFSEIACCMININEEEWDNVIYTSTKIQPSTLFLLIFFCTLNGITPPNSFFVLRNTVSSLMNVATRIDIKKHMMQGVLMTNFRNRVLAKLLKTENKYLYIFGRHSSLIYHKIMLHKHWQRIFIQNIYYCLQASSHVHEFWHH